MAEKNMNAKISVEFEETANRQQLSSGDNLPTLFGKIKKFFTDLKTVAFSGSYNDLSDIPIEMTGATSSAAGTSGLVPAPAAGKQASYLRGDGTWAVPTNTDTKVTNTLNATAKAYVTGTTSSSTNTGTQVFDTGVYLDTTAGMLTATTFKGELSGNASTSNKLKSTSYTTITINTSDWTTNSDGGYMCTKTLDNAIPYENFNFDVMLSTDQAAAKLQIEAWSCVIADGRIAQTTSNGSTTAFTFYAFTTKPSVALTVAVQGVS